MGGRLCADHSGTHQSDLDLFAIELTRKVPLHLARLVAVLQPQIMSFCLAVDSQRSALGVHHFPRFGAK
ncbi:hypothetical protein A3D68_01795 [Candidatus Adlerbacteria bacterium RIFCSPHIGHO2_02_FULL_52_17]|uniref:Uncharacterized protein n=1 Tax=Candidatus Adlerbacteria bacterium RIFCSPHIGHO2_02_FULL_52_17 TaxID=1797240 RepID=A0A1F4XQM9_9BACT|nr:MAG: hypothetical protein A3D68_01795 [Candidatus Adlerbacteria bacterium RIFCSPHIGHO2_02_FULL_52_17]